MEQKVLPLRSVVVFWTLYFAYEWFGMAALSGDYRSYFMNACVALPLAFSCSYFTVNILVKKYYDSWPRWKFWSVQIIISMLLVLAKRCLNYFVVYPLYFPHALALPFFSVGKLIVDLVNVYLIVGVYALFFFVRNRDEQRRKVALLIQENTSAELSLLKFQIQPHFIFNTLNNIYSTALKTSPETARLINHLSSFLNYNLYDAKLDVVPLQAELTYLKSYLELQQNRYGSRLDTSVKVYDDISEMTIAPLLVLPLIENCFKHGVSSSIHQAWVQLDISKQDRLLIIKIENGVDGTAKIPEHVNGGLGLKNVRRRLELQYPGRHEFRTMAGKDSYLVILKINTVQ